MPRIRHRLTLSFFIALCTYALASAQAGEGTSSSQVKVVPTPVEVDAAADAHAKKVPAPRLTPATSPFAIDNPKHGSEHSIRVLSEDQMSRSDSNLVADAQSSIQERAGIENLEFNGGGWTYQQLVCPALPNHVFLRFTRDKGTRQMTMFSAAVPRNGEGRVHIIPIIRKGYSLFSPAPIGAMTIAAFNRIRGEEGAGASADWLGTGLCYAALAGANPQVGESESSPSKPGASATNDVVPTEMDVAKAIPPTLVITPDGGAVIRFADVSTAPHPMEWNMVFDPKGKLIKAMHNPAYVPTYGKQPVKTLDVGAAKP